MKTIKGYKFITSEMKSKEGDCKWTIGKWKEHKGELRLCGTGFHACRTALQSLSYVYGDKWFIVEAKGKFNEEEGDKFVCSKMRLVREIPIDNIVKRFALFCAKQSLKNYTKQYPNDNRVSECIRVTELYLDGKVSIEKLGAARSAAWSAARSAARSAAWSAESAARSAAWSAESAESAARSAAWSAESAESAARSAAWSAESAESAARKEQSRYLDYLIKKELKVTGAFS